MPRKLHVNTKQVVETWIAADGNVSETARQMNLSRRTVYEHLSRAGYFEWRHGGPGHLQFKRRLPEKKKIKPDDDWRLAVG